jgi:hypothetical protein
MEGSRVPDALLEFRHEGRDGVSVDLAVKERDRFCHMFMAKRFSGDVPVRTVIWSICARVDHSTTRVM